MSQDNQETVPVSQNANKSLKGMTLVTKIMTIIIGFIILVASRYAFVFFLLGIIPSIASLIIDKRSMKYASSTVGAFNMIGLMPYLFELWFSNNLNGTAQGFIGSTRVWVTIYGTTAIGWLVIWNFPQICGKLFQARALVKINKLKTEQNAIIEEWGAEVKDDPPAAK